MAFLSKRDLNSDIILHKSGPILYVSATNHDFPLALKSGFNLQQNVYKSNFLCHFVSVLRIPSLLWGHPYSCILLVPESCSEMMTITSSENLIFNSSEIKVSMFQFLFRFDLKNKKQNKINAFFSVNQYVSCFFFSCLFVSCFCSLVFCFKIVYRTLDSIWYKIPLFNVFTDCINTHGVSFSLVNVSKRPHQLVKWPLISLFLIEFYIVKKL